jgi:hypothetical protein
LPCCEQAICDGCHATLPASCPVCEHSPLSADDCKPHKALRTTIKVFLRTEEKKRESNRPKDVPVTPVTPIEPSAISAAVATVQEPVSLAERARSGEEQQPVVTDQGAGSETPAENQEGKDAVSEEEHGAMQNTADDAVGHPRSLMGRSSFANGKQDQPSHGADGEAEAGASTDLVPVQQDSELVEGGNAEEGKEGDQNGDNEANPDGSVAAPEGMSGALPTAGFAPGFDQMQMMMAMQNGFGNFPMMG